jgi:hypothetical protein
LAWLATDDIKDEHVMIRANADGTYDVAGIDFAHSMDVPADGGTVQVANGPPVLVLTRDKNVIRSMVEKIEQTTDQQIREIVESLPDALLKREGKGDLIAGLCARRGRIRLAMEGHGWLS